MIDWLRRDVEPVIELGSRTLPVALTRRKGAKRMILRVADDGTHVKLTLPRWASTREALEFAESRAGWIAEALNRIPTREPPRPGGTIAYRGAELEVSWLPEVSRKPVLLDDAIRLGGPESSLVARLRRWLEGEAQALMEADLMHYCTAAEVAAPRLRLSRARRRWGSCSSDGTVRINWRLVQAPDHVRRSVVAHEVAHLVHFDHSREFHALFARIFDDDAKAADKWLKTHGRSLYGQFD
jgi:hypothetical protein